MTFEAIQQELGPAVGWDWIDIEDDEAVLGAVDVIDFPTLLIARGDTILFFGPLPPHAQTLRQLVQRAAADSLGEVKLAALDGLPARIRARG